MLPLGQSRSKTQSSYGFHVFFNVLSYLLLVTIFKTNISHTRAHLFVIHKIERSGPSLEAKEEEEGLPSRATRCTDEKPRCKLARTHTSIHTRIHAQARASVLLITSLLQNGARRRVLAPRH